MERLIPVSLSIMADLCDGAGLAFERHLFSDVRYAPPTGDRIELITALFIRHHFRLQERAYARRHVSPSFAAAALPDRSATIDMTLSPPHLSEYSSLAYWAASRRSLHLSKPSKSKRIYMPIRSRLPPSLNGSSISR